MAKIIIGSARIDERGKLSGGKAGDSKQTGIDDYSGEVSLQNFYHHKKGWYILRWLDPVYAEECAKAMYRACNNSNIGYDQTQRSSILLHGTMSTVKTECDCSSLVRLCIREASAVDPGNFTTDSEVAALKKTGLFAEKIKYKSGTPLYNGDVLVTCTKGHTAVVVSALPRIKNTLDVRYYPQYFGKDTSIVNALVSLGHNASKEQRKKIAAVNGLPGYTGTAKENTQLLSLLKKGLLIMP